MYQDFLLLLLGGHHINLEPQRQWSSHNDQNKVIKNWVEIFFISKDFILCLMYKASEIQKLSWKITDVLLFILTFTSEKTSRVLMP